MNHHRPIAKTAALSVAALFVIAACDAGPGAKADSAKAAKAETSPAAGLAAYVGKYPFDPVNGVTWNDHEIVKAGIAAAVTDPAVRGAIATVKGPSGPIEKKGGKLISWSCQAHNCAAHQWSVQVDPATGATDVCYFNEKTSATEARWFLADGKEEKRAGQCQ